MKARGSGFDTRSISPSADSRRAVVSYWQKYGHLVQVIHLRGLNLPRNSMVRLTHCPDMTIAVKCGHKATRQQYNRSVEAALKSGHDISFYRKLSFRGINCLFYGHKFHFTPMLMCCRKTKFAAIKYMIYRLN